MRIRTLTLKNVKLLAEQTFSFLEEDGSIRNWTVLLGENGVCKTTILQAIAIASSGDRMAAKLVGDAADYVDVSKPEAETLLHASFDIGRSAPLDVSMRVAPGSHAFVGDDGAQEFNAIRDRREGGYLVVGYGIGRRLPKPGEVAIAPDPVADRVEGLFDTHHKMLGVDFFEALQKEGKKLGLRYAEALGNVLLAEDLQGNRLLPWLVSFDRRGHKGVNEMKKLLESRRLAMDVGRAEPVKLPPQLLSQGYQSTFAWIADLLGHAFLDAGQQVAASKIEGIVLLDEIDLHLHPRWQRRLVPLLREVFPRMQFIATTHSPLVLTGFDAHEIISLELGDGAVRQKRFEREPALQSTTELMAEYFDVAAAARPELEAKQIRFALLRATERRTTKENEELRTLQSELDPYLGSTDLADLPAPDEIDADGA